MVFKLKHKKILDNLHLLNMFSSISHYTRLYSMIIQLLIKPNHSVTSLDKK